MAYKERTDEEIVVAYEEWAKWYPYQSEPIEPVLMLDKAYSSRDIAVALRKCLEGNGDENDKNLFRIFVDFSRKICKENDDDVVALILRPIEASKRMDHKDIWVHGSAYGKNYDFHCKWVSRAPIRAEFCTDSEPFHTIALSPRYQGSMIGSDDMPKDKKNHSTTICAFYFDGEYAALAFFEEKEDKIEIIVHEY